MRTQYTRRDFYDLVWSKPMTRLAEELGVSDVALHKVCKKHGIPKPPQGWWIRKEAGKSQERTPLTELGQGQSETIIISSSPISDEPATIAKAREEAERVASSFDPSSSDVEDPIVAKSIAMLREAKPDEQGLVSIEGRGLIEIRIAPTSIDRVKLALNRIAAAADTQGFKFKKADERVVFSDGHTDLPFRLKETVSRTKHEATPAELAKEEGDQKDRNRRWARNGWGSAPVSTFTRHWPKYDHKPTGKVTFEFEISGRLTSSFRHSFRDAKVQRLEDLANQIGIALVVLAEAKRVDQKRREEENRRAAAFEERRVEAQRQTRIQNRRVEGLEKVLSRFARRDQLRMVLAALSYQSEFSATPRTEEFNQWLKSELRDAEFSLSIDRLEKLFESERLFGDDDDHGFYPPNNGW